MLRSTASSFAAFALVAGALSNLSPAHATPAEMRPILQRLLNTYRGCIVEKYETPETANVTRRDGSTCGQGQACTRAQREAAFAALTRQASAGNDQNFSERLQRAMLADCMQCAKHRKWHTKHVHCTMDCGGNDDFRDGWRPGKGGCFEGCKAGVDATKWFTQIGREIAQALGVVKPTEAADHLGGDKVASNRRTVNNFPSEGCRETSVPGDYFLAPPTLLDWTPSRTPAFRITLIDSLKALAVAAGVVGGGIAGGLAPFLAPVLPAIVGGITAIAAHGVPSVALGLPEPEATTSRRKMNTPLGQNIGAAEGRLIPMLRAAARAADPLASLCRSATEFARSGNNPRHELGRAFADLAVTGRRAYARFRRLAPRDATVIACLKAPASPVRRMSVSTLQRAAALTLDRAYTVARILRIGGWPSAACPQRNKLGWIAVSGEDDQPHRPVNVPSSGFPQYDMSVRVNGRIDVNTRYLIMHAKPPKAAPSCASAGTNSRALPVEPVPALDPKADVLLFIHGMDSRAEEAEDLARELKKISASTGRNWTIVAVDMPTSGYADNLDHTRISPISRLGELKFRFNGKADLELTDLQVFNARGKQDVPLLDFIQSYIVAFVDKLGKVLPHLKSRIRAVVGGSLGGNMSLRLGQTALPWIRNVIPWSPAAIWTSYAGGANPGNHLGVAMPVMWAGADARQREETPARRREFFYKAFDWTAGILKRKPQSEEWYRDKWTCKRTHLAGARLDRHETYDQNFRLWHWRLGAEQIIFSHQSPPRYLQNRKRTLLLCGYEDTGGDLCLHTRNVAPKMVNTPGKALFLRDTGHSIHNERPCWLAQHIVEFLGAPIGSCR